MCKRDSPDRLVWLAAEGHLAPPHPPLPLTTTEKRPNSSYPRLWGVLNAKIDFSFP